MFSWPAYVFRLTGSQDGIGELIIRGQAAEYSGADHRGDFRIRRNFWGTKWLHEGDGDRLFAKVSIGFKHIITLADGTRYRMRMKRNWRIFSRKAADEYTHMATFYREETEVMRLENHQPLPFFSSEASAPMSGPIITELRDGATIAGLLLLFQTYLLTTRNAAAGAGG
jgi:hypothetical protein